MIRPLVALVAITVGAGPAAAQAEATAPAPPPAPAAAPPPPPASPPPSPDPEKPIAPKPPKKTPELLEAGKKVYEVNCLMCHGEKGDGTGPVGLALVPKPRDFAKEPFKQGTKPEQVFLSITGGVKDTPMVGYPQLSEADRWALTYFVLEMVPKPDKGAKSKGKKAAAPATP